MNEQHAYEKHLADQLQSLPPAGDAKKNWPLMKSILDREMPESGRKTGGGKWWLLGSIIAISLISGIILFYTERNNAENVKNTDFADYADSAKQGHRVDPANAQHRSVVDPGSRAQTASSDLPNNTSAQPENNRTGLATGAEQPNNRDNQTSSDPRSLVTTDQKKSAAEKKITGIDKIGETDKVDVNNKPEAGTSSRSIKDRHSILPEGKRSLSGHSEKGRKSPGTHLASGGQNTSRKQDRGVADKEYPAGTSFTNSKAKQPALLTEEEKDFTSSNRAYTDHSANSALVNTGLLIRDSIRKNYSGIVVTTERSRFKMKTDRVKALRNRVVGTGENKNFVVGLTFPLAFPLSDQRVVAYNVNARANTISDYLPAPNIQYHFSQKSYLQAEVQFASPQYIEPALLAMKRYELGPGNYYRFVTSSVFARKLYYFNLPLELHYSPFKNFYLGSGLQFSSLMSGVGYSEEKGYNTMGPNARDSVIRQSYFKFKNDTLSGRLNGNEVRVLLDANYYWKKFTVGLRYNQAVNSYINLQINNNLPPYSERNKTLQFYLRYNIWENRKK
jgi:hypothetical protein